MFTLPIYHTTRGWSINQGWWMVWLWLSLPLTGLGQQTTDSLMAKQTGVGVFGPAVGVHVDTLSVWGDVILDSATVTGNGILSLRGHSLNEPTMPQRIVAQHAQVDHLHLASSGKIILLGDLYIEQKLTVEKSVFDISAGELMKSSGCQTRLLQGGRISKQPIWLVQNTEPKTRLTNVKLLVGVQADEEISLFGYLAEPPTSITYQPEDYQFSKTDSLSPPPKELKVNKSKGRSLNILIHKVLQLKS